MIVYLAPILAETVLHRIQIAYLVLLCLIELLPLTVHVNLAFMKLILLVQLVPILVIRVLHQQQIAYHVLPFLTELLPLTVPVKQDSMSQVNRFIKVNI